MPNPLDCSFLGSDSQYLPPIYDSKEIVRMTH